MKTIRTLNMENGAISGICTFDGETVKIDGANAITFNEVVEIVAKTIFCKGQTFAIAYNRNGEVHFRHITKMSFLANPTAFLYFNGKRKKAEFCFRFRAQYADYYDSLPMITNSKGYSFDIDEAEFAEYNKYIEEYGCNYGHISEFHLSGDLRDVSEWATRQKRHDVWSHYETKSGKQSKYKTSAELKTSLAGGKNTLLIAKHQDKTKPLSSGYKKTNALISFEF